MSESNREIAQRFYRDLLAYGRREVADEILTPDFVDHEASRVGPEGFLAWLTQFVGAFRNRVIVVEEAEVDGEFVSVRWIGSLVHSGPFMGFEPSGATIELSGVDVLRLEAGRIAERWNHESGLGLRQQLELRDLGKATRLRLIHYVAASAEPAVAAAH